MLNVIAALFVVFGLIGLCAFLLRFLQSKGRLAGNWMAAKSGAVVESSVPIDGKRTLVTLIYRERRYVFMFGPRNDILLESAAVARAIERLERHHA